MVRSLAELIGHNAFAGRPPQIIAAVLADLMSTLLINHKIPDDLAAQKTLRDEILTEWCATVRQIVALEDDPPATETLQ